MAKNDVQSWDSSPAGNTDIAGTNIAVGCPPSDVGIFMRTIMAQLAVYFATLVTAAATYLDLLLGTSATLALTPKALFDSVAYLAVTDNATVTLDLTQRLNFTLTKSVNGTLANPTGLKSGQSGIVVITQDGTGSRTLSYGTAWKFKGGAPLLSTTAGSVDVLSYAVVSPTLIIATLSKSFS